MIHERNKNNKINVDTKSIITKNLYTGQPFVGKRTVMKRIMAETKFARCEYHSVSEVNDPTKIIHDWLFMEERDAINVAVINDKHELVVFEQEKYALPGTTLSIVGGFIEDGETPYDSAKREVMEELGLGSQYQQQRQQREQRQLQSSFFSSSSSITSNLGLISTWDAEVGRIHDNDPDWIYLGKYRTSSNRGGGYLYSYLLKNAIPIKPKGGTEEYKSSGDGEPQKILFLNQEEVLVALSKSQFKEIKWTATITLALLHLQGMPGDT